MRVLISGGCVKIDEDDRCSSMSTNVMTVVNVLSAHNVEAQKVGQNRTRPKKCKIVIEKREWLSR